MPLLRNLPMSARVPLLVALLMVGVGIVASQLVLGAMDRQQDAHIRELARVHVEALSVALGPHVLRKDIWEVYDTLERAAGASEGRRTVFSAVADVDGRVLAATDPARAPVDSDIAALSEGAQRPEELSVAPSTGIVRLIAPLVYQGRHVGQVLTELDISDLVAARREASRLLLLGNAIMTGVLALFGYLAVRRMLMPVARLVGWMSDSEGAPRPFPADELPAGDSELARLVRSYNDMAASVAEKADTERRLAERERYVSLGRLSSSLAHEINNPLGGLLNATDTIRTYPDKAEVVKQSAELLHRGLKHMRDVAKATLELNRVDRSQTPLKRDDFDDLKLLIGPEVRYRQQRLDWEVDVDGVEQTGLPAAPVRQIVLNLLLNATKAAGEGGRVGLRAELDRDGLKLEISDSGPGLDEAARKRLMGEGPTMPSGGVGLRMVHELVTRLIGRLDLAREDEATRICVWLPVRKSGEAAC